MNDDKPNKLRLEEEWISHHSMNLEFLEFWSKVLQWSLFQGFVEDHNFQSTRNLLQEVKVQFCSPVCRAGSDTVFAKLEVLGCWIVFSQGDNDATVSGE